MRIIFSRDRAAQLDLLLQSLEKNTMSGNTASTAVLWKASDDDYVRGYDRVQELWPLVRFHYEQDFDTDFRAPLVFADSGYVTFLCDDDVLYRKVPAVYPADVMANEDVLTFSLRLKDPWEQPWTWHDLPRHDWGYPGSIDGHTFRVSDVLRMVEGQTIENPLMLETILAHRCDAFRWWRPYMAAYAEQALVGVPVNTVADDQRRPHGEFHSQPAYALNQRFLNGERIDLDALDFTGVDGCLHEIPFHWRDS